MLHQYVVKYHRGVPETNGPQTNLRAIFVCRKRMAIFDVRTAVGIER